MILINYGIRVIIILLRASLHKEPGPGVEIDPMTIGMSSIPLILVGLFLFCFPDLVFRFFTFSAFRSMKPNHEFEENIQYKEPRKLTLRLIKIIGLLLFLFGIYLFWFAEDFYNYWYN